MRVDGNHGSTIHYEPNSYGEWQEQPEHKERHSTFWRCNIVFSSARIYDNYFEQPGKLFNLMSEEQKQLLFENTARSIGAADGFPNFVISGMPTKQILHNVEGVANALGISLERR